MNDIEKLSPDMKKMLALRSLQESTDRIKERMNASRALMQGVPLSEVSQLDPLVPINTLADVGDGQDNLLPRSELPNGITFTLSPWEPMDESGYDIYFAMDDNNFPAQPVRTVLPGFDPEDVTLALGDLRLEHGQHRVRWEVQGHDTGNPLQGLDLPFFVDILAPNLHQQPDRPLLPEDLPNGEITQEYLEQNGGVTFTLPEWADPRIGDKFTFYINSVPFISEQDAPADNQVTIPAADFARLPEGNITLIYYLYDRAGNRSDQSLETVVYFAKSPAPVLRAPTIPQGPDITLADARDGVIVQHDFDFHTSGDFVSVKWEGVDTDSILYPTPAVKVPLSIIKVPGEIYTATVLYQVHRNGRIYDSPSTTVTVDLERVGPGPDPDVPDEIVNPKLDPLVLVSSTGVDNTIAPPDKNQDATITVPLYTPVNVGEMIETFYGGITNSLGARKLIQTDIDNGEITVNVPWALIQTVGNGTIDAFYRIFPDGKPENVQQSPTTPVLVTVHNLEALPVAVFPDRNVNLNIINCVNEPWLNGVNVRLAYPDFEAGDLVNLNWVLDSTLVPPTHPTVPTDPLESTRMNFPHEVTAIEAAAGAVVINVWWGPHISDLTEGCIVVEWTLQRGDVHGSSDQGFARYSRHRPGTGRPVCPDDDPA